MLTFSCGAPNYTMLPYLKQSPLPGPQQNPSNNVLLPYHALLGDEWWSPFPYLACTEFLASCHQQSSFSLEGVFAGLLVPFVQFKAICPRRLHIKHRSSSCFHVWPRGAVWVLLSCLVLHVWFGGAFTVLFSHLAS